MTQKETLSVGNAHSPRGGGQTSNPTTIIQGNDFYNIKYQTKPFMIWIWLSTILLASGGLVNFFIRK